MKIPRINDFDYFTWYKIWNKSTGLYSDTTYGLFRLNTLKRIMLPRCRTTLTVTITDADSTFLCTDSNHHKFIQLWQYFFNRKLYRQTHPGVTYPCWKSSVYEKSSEITTGRESTYQELNIEEHPYWTMNPNLLEFRIYRDFVTTLTLFMNITLIYS